MSTEVRHSEPTTPNTPAANTPAANTTAGNTPAGNTPAANTPAANTTAGNTPAANTPAANTTAGNTPAANTAAPHTASGPSPAVGSSSEGPDFRRRSTTFIIVAAAFIILALITAVLLTDQGDPAPAAGAGEALELSLGEGDALASCLPLDPAILADMSPAFAATATAVEGETVTLAVDRWYAGGDADTVVLQAPAGLEALIAGFDLEVGERYLITASQGTVNYCGYSGPATPELQAAFDQAFPG